jgi:hypothetical protein
MVTLVDKLEPHLSSLIFGEFWARVVLFFIVRNCITKWSIVQWSNVSLKGLSGKESGIKKIKQKQTAGKLISVSTENNINNELGMK